MLPPGKQCILHSFKTAKRYITVMSSKTRQRSFPTMKLSEFNVPK